MHCDELLCLKALFGRDRQSRCTSNLLTVQPRRFNALFRALMQVCYLFFALLKRKVYLPTSQRQHVAVNSLKDIVHIAARELHTVLQCLTVCVRVNVPLFEKHKINAALVQCRICLHALGSVAAHTAHAVKDDSITGTDGAEQLIPFLAVELCSRVFLLQYDCIGKLAEYVAYLPLYILLAGANPAISVCHTSPFRQYQIKPVCV